MTAEQLAEFERLLSDRDWCLENLYLIRNEDGATVPYVARAEQLEFRQQRHTRNYVPKARKLGLSTEIVLENLHDCLFPPAGMDGLVCGIVDLKAEDAEKKLGIAKFSWDVGPKHPDPMIAAIWAMIHEACPLTNNNGKGAKNLLEWANGSEMKAGVSFTGRTPQRLHISEYGPISSQNPKKAAEIQRGSINSVPPEGIVDIETTMEGGRFGLNYHYFKLAKKKVGKELASVEYKLHFFSWLNHPSYRLSERIPTHGEILNYFKGLAEQGIDVSLERQAWYEARREELGDEIYQQYPTTIDECDKALVLGAIFPQMATVRAQGRVRDFNPTPGYPFYAAFDLGNDDHMAGWCVQPAAKEINMLDWATGEGGGAADVANIIRRWDAQFGRLERIFLPHDAKTNEKGSGTDFVTQLVACGIERNRIFVLDRIHDVWAGIGEVRKRIGQMWFHSRCDVETKVDGEEIPSGVARIEGYRKNIKQGQGRIMPVKDNVCDHVADALRYFCEADAASLVYATGKQKPWEGKAEEAILYS